MKVNYLPKNKLKNPYLRRIIILIAIFVFGSVVLSFFDRFIVSFFSPIWKVENIVARNFRIGTDLFKSKKSLAEENLTLRERVSSLELKIVSLSKDQIQSDIFLGLVGRAQTTDAILASVLTHPPQTLYDIIIVDVGANDNIILDSLVSLPEGPYLGKVFEVFPNIAKVRLFSSDGEKTNAILERNNIPVILIGSGAGNFKLVLPHDIAVEKGDRILSVDIASQVLAVVGDVRVKSTDAFKEVLAKSPANIFSLRFVFVTP